MTVGQGTRGRPGPLEGIRVVELGSMYAAPTAGRMLRDFGATLIKVEDPVHGDFARQWQPAHHGLALGFSRLNSGKRSVGIDLRRPEGREVATELVRGADILIESFRPGRLEAWGMGYDALAAVNPGLVLVRVSGFGQTGPYRERPGFGTVAETASGYAFLNGWPDTPPTAPPFGFADSIAGISAAFGATMALYRRSVTGTGAEVDVALYEPLMFILGDAILHYTAGGQIMQRQGNSSGAASPRGIYRAADGGWLSIAGSNQTIAMRLFEAMGMPELRTDPRYATNQARMANNGSLQEIVTGWVGSRPRAEILAVLAEQHVVAAPVNDAKDICEDPHFVERTLVPLANTVLGPAMMPGPVLHVRGAATPAYDGVPAVGQHTEEVLLGMVGLSRSRLAGLAAAGVVSSVPAAGGAPLDPDLARLREVAARRGLPPISGTTPAEARERVRAGNRLCRAGPALHSVDDLAVPAGDRRIRVRRYRPGAEPTGRTLVYLHGGGWVTGDLDYADETCRYLARDAGSTVVSVDYRLAPEHPYPAALDDAYAVLAWAAQHAPPELLAVGGDSAGGNLAAACALRSRDAGWPRVAAQLLVCPVLDHDLTRGSYASRAGAFPLGREAMRWFWDNYAPTGVDRTDPLVSPLRAADFAGLPPAAIVVAGHDPLRDEGVRYAERLRAADVDVLLREHPALGHGFLRFTAEVPAAAEAVGELAGMLRRLLDGAHMRQTADSAAATDHRTMPMI